MQVQSGPSETPHLTTRVVGRMQQCTARDMPISRYLYADMSQKRLRSAGIGSRLDPVNSPRRSTTPHHAIRLACRRAERAGAAVALGLDLRGYLTGAEGTVEAAREAGYLAWGYRLTLQGLALWQAEAVDAAARKAERAAQLQAELERVRSEARAAEEARAAQLRQLEQLGAFQRLLDELRALRGALEACDACPAPVASPLKAGAGACAPLGPSGAAGRGGAVADVLGPSDRSAAARSDRSARRGGGPVLCVTDGIGGRSKLSVCWSRQPSCLQPRARGFLVSIPGGSKRTETPAAKKSRLAWERARALRALERAAARWLSVETLCGPHRYRKVPPAGADLAPYLASSRKERRRQRPLYAAGMLQQEAMVVAGQPQRLTEAGRAYLLGRLVEEQRRHYGLQVQAVAA